MVVGIFLDIAFTAVIIASKVVSIAYLLAYTYKMTGAKYNRHLWDVPVCWLNATYIKVCNASQKKSRQKKNIPCPLEVDFLFLSSASPLPYSWGLHSSSRNPPSFYSIERSSQ